MESLALAILLTVHIAAALALSAFGYHRMQLARLRRRLEPATTRPPRSRDPHPPRVTVQIPLFNEMYVAERAIRAVAALEYARDRLEIQVLDDSTDETSDRVRAVVTELQQTGHNINHLKRTHRTGYKAGALAEGLLSATGELIAIFDADFVPHADFLLRVVPEFHDEHVGMVQARWSYINEDTSWLTRAQALQLDAHFTVEHSVRQAAGCFFNFNGTAGIWRRTAINDAGGWHADTLTEDLDLSYRAQLRGWRFVYRDDVSVPSELPVEVAAYRVQQQRWAQGGVETARKLLPVILRSDTPRFIKTAAAWHLLIHFSYVLLLLVTLAGLSVGLLSQSLSHRWVLAADGILLTLAMGSLGFFYAVTARARDRSRWLRRMWLVPVIMIIGAGISVGQTAAVMRGLFGRRVPFERTPKYHVANGDDSWRRRRYRIGGARAGWIEGIGGVALLVAAILEAISSNVPPSGLVLLLGIGLVTVSTLTLAQGTVGRWIRRTDDQSDGRSVGPSVS